MKKKPISEVQLINRTPQSNVLGMEGSVLSRYYRLNWVYSGSLYASSALGVSILTNIVLSSNPGDLFLLRVTVANGGIQKPNMIIIKIGIHLSGNNISITETSRLDTSRNETTVYIVDGKVCIDINAVAYSYFFVEDVSYKSYGFTIINKTV